MLYNMLSFPAGVVPVSTVTAKDEEELKHYKGHYQDHWDKLFKQVVNVVTAYVTVHVLFETNNKNVYLMLL